MAESEIWVGVKDVFVTPDGGSAILFALVTDDSVELEVTVEDLVFKSASGIFDQTAVTTRISYQVTINTKEVDLADTTLANVGVNGDCTVAWTLLGKGGASGSDRTYSLNAKLMNEPGVGATDGLSATQSQLTFRGISTDGTTSPLTRP